MTTTANSERRMTRRGFVGATAAAVALPWIIRSSALGADGAVAPSDRLTLGLIGRGCMGRGHLTRLAGDSDVQLLAVCDVDRDRRERAKAQTEKAYGAKKASGAYKGCAAYNEFERVVEREDIDAVVIGFKSTEEIDEALERMNRHQRRTGVPYEPIMVFPQGIFSERAMSVLKRRNFVAAVNTT